MAHSKQLCNKMYTLNNDKKLQELQDNELGTVAQFISILNATCYMNIVWTLCEWLIKEVRAVYI